MKLPKELEFDWESARDDIENAIRFHFKNTGADKAVIGISGGVDSAVAAYLATEALGKKNVLALLLPEEGVTPSEDLEDAREVVRLLGVESKLIEISPIVKSIAGTIPEIVVESGRGVPKDAMAYANLKARVRMILLYAEANMLGRAQVIGTGDKSELLLGYCTKFGDHGVDLLPIGDLYKSQVRFLAEKLGVPKRVWTKAPAPRLLRGQTAQSEIGASYDVIDRILYYKVEERYPEEKIAEELGVPLPLVQRICRMIIQSHHKRKSPPICKIGSATINLDWRMPTE